MFPCPDIALLVLQINQISILLHCCLLNLISIPLRMCQFLQNEDKSRFIYVTDLIVIERDKVVSGPTSRIYKG